MTQEIPRDNLVSVTGSAIAAPSVSARQQESDQLHARVLKLRDEMAGSYFGMGELLYRMSREGLWAYQNNPATRKPYEKFSEYVESEVGFQYRKAKYLMSTWYYFAETLGSPRVSEKIKEIGWRKASRLVGLVDEKNVDVWVEKAKRLPVPKLDLECKLALQAAEKKRRPKAPTAPTGDDVRDGKVTEKTGVDGQPLVSGALPSPTPASGAPEHARLGVDPLPEGQVREMRRPWKIIITGAQADNIERAIDAASDMAGVNSDGKGFLLDFIATHFLSFVSGSAAENIDKHKGNFQHDLLSKIEAYLGIEIIAVEPGTNEVMFGNQVVERIQGEGNDEGQS